jgi:hypothetical protein
MVMVIPPVNGAGDGTAVPDRSDGRSGLFVATGPITPTLRRDVPSFNMRLVGLVDDVLQRHGTPSQTGPASTPEAIEDQKSSVGPQRSINEVGHPSGREQWPLEVHQTMSRKHLMEHRRSATFGRQDIKELGFPMGNG